MLEQDIVGGLGVGKLLNPHFDSNPSGRLLSSPRFKLVSGAEVHLGRQGFPGKRWLSVPVSEEGW